jgi:hypothetical protein
MPMKLWSVRLLENAMRVPSGENRGPAVPAPRIDERRFTFFDLRFHGRRDDGCAIDLAVSHVHDVLAVGRHFRIRALCEPACRTWRRRPHGPNGAFGAIRIPAWIRDPSLTIRCAAAHEHDGRPSSEMRSVVRSVPSSLRNDVTRTGANVGAAAVKTLRNPAS